MPQAPYTPVPDVTPTERGPGPVSISTPGAAFGTNVAQAIEGVGGKLDQVGGEIFQRAQAMQELENRATSDKAVMDFVEAMGQRHADFAALQGDDARKAFPQYMADVNAMREKFGQGLNPMARRYYDAESRGQAARTIFNGAGHAATQFKDFQIQNSVSRVNLAGKDVAGDPDDEAMYNSRVQEAKDAANNEAALRGFGEDSDFAQDKAKKAISQVTLSRLLAKARDEPNAAMDLYQKLKGNLYGPDVDHAEAAILGQQRGVGATNIAQSVFDTMFDANGKQIKSNVEAEAEVRQRAAEFSPKDNMLANNAVRTLQSLNVRRTQAEKMDDWTLQQQVRDIIQQHPEIRTEQELRSLPEARAALDNLNFKGKGIDAPGYIHRYIQSRFNEVNEQTFYSLKALSQTNRDQFLDIDFTKEQLNDRQIDQLNALRSRLIKHPDDDPNLRRALGWMQGSHGTELQALGIDKRTEQNKDDYDRYQGAMLQALEAWQTNNKRMPGFKDVTEEIGPQVIQSHTVPGKWFGTNEVPAYKMEPPANFIKKIRDEFPNRSDAQIQKDYTSYLFQVMFGPTVSPADIVKTKTGTGGMNVPGVNPIPDVPTSK